MIKAAAGKELGLDIDKTWDLVDEQAKNKRLVEFGKKAQALLDQSKGLSAIEIGIIQDRIEKEYERILRGLPGTFDDQIQSKTDRQIEKEWAEGFGDDQGELQEWESQFEKDRAVGKGPKRTNAEKDIEIEKAVDRARNNV